MRLPNMLKFWT